MSDEDEDIRIHTFTDLDWLQPPTDHAPVLDPHDRWADPNRTARVHTRVDDEERRERDADAALSDYGSAAINRRRGDD